MISRGNPVKPPENPHVLYPNPVPTAQTTVETCLVGRHELGIRLVYVTDNPDDPANKGCHKKGGWGPLVWALIP
jgi:hypothetical protein